MPEAALDEDGDVTVPAARLADAELCERVVLVALTAPVPCVERAVPLAESERWLVAAELPTEEALAPERVAAPAEALGAELVEAPVDEP